jgi:hypothetical protein
VVYPHFKACLPSKMLYHASIGSFKASFVLFFPPFCTCQCCHRSHPKSHIWRTFNLFYSHSTHSYYDSHSQNSLLLPSYSNSALANSEWSMKLDHALNSPRLNTQLFNPHLAAIQPTTLCSNIFKFSFSFLNINHLFFFF